MFDDVAGERDQAQSGAEAHQGRGDREPHRGKRTEAEQQDHDRGGDADDGRESERRLLRLFDRLAAELNLEPRRAGGLGRRDHPVHGRFRERVGALVEVHRGERDRGVRGNRVLAGAVWADDARDVRQPRDPCDRRRHGGSVSSIGELAGSRVEDDLVGIARLSGEAALE